MATKLQLHFDPNLDYQIDAIQSAVDIFDGFSPTQVNYTLGDEIKANLAPYQALDESWLFDNVVAVQERLPNHTRDQFPMVRSLEVDEGLVLDGAGVETIRYPSFTVEMETGTGKTYVYLRTIHELFKNYGFRKYIIVVPSVAIYEGVVKTFDITRTHFRALYGNETVNLTRYDSSRLNQLRDFATSSFIEIAVLTIDSFNRAGGRYPNRIFRPSEQLPGELLPYQFVQRTRPILILDEPQNMSSDTAKAALRTLHPLFALRYSATHRETPNLVFQLTPFEAFRRNLVKKIKVKGITERDNFNRPFIALEAIERNPWRASLRTYVLERGRPNETTIVLKQDENLYDTTNRQEHSDGWIVEEMQYDGRTKEGSVVFANGEVLKLNNVFGPTREEIFRVQIEHTVEQHMQVQHDLQPLGIKVLSLFFIDRVANYVDDDGLVRRLFIDAYNKYKDRFPFFADKPVHRVHEGYFAKRKRKGSDEEEAFDTSGSNKTEQAAERAAFELIMRNKEQLLSFDEDTCFIFAHSALKEGWDNPNVFQICTLNQTVSDMKKRQEIGRGLRIPVNQQGERIFDEDVTILTVVANESYEHYVQNLQSEYVEAGQAAPPAPANASTRDATAYRNDDLFTNPQFRTFWDRLCRVTDYSLHIDTEQLVARCIERLNNESIPRPRIVVQTGSYIWTRFTFTLENVRGNKARIRLSVEDTNNTSETSARDYTISDDFAKLRNEPRLRGFTVTAVSPTDGGAVIFSNGATVTAEAPYTFETEAGVRAAESATLTSEAAEQHSAFNLLDRAARATQLTRPTLNRIFRGLSDRKKSEFLTNPEGFAGVFVNIIQNELIRHVAQNIEFIVTDRSLNFDIDALFPSQKDFPQKELVPGGNNGLYDKTQVDSDIEKRFVENRLVPEGRVLGYFKFPPKFKIPFPRIIGNYNPDWGILWEHENGHQVFTLVRETKGSEEREKLQWAHEQHKVSVAQRYFDTLDIDYRIITDETHAWWEATTHVSPLLREPGS